MKEIDRHYLFDLSPQNQNEKRGKWIIRFLLSYQLFNLRNPIIVIYDKTNFSLFYLLLCCCYRYGQLDRRWQYWVLGWIDVIQGGSIVCQ